MNSRQNTRSKSSLMVKKSEKMAAIVKIKIEEKTLFRCVMCGNIYPRRFNAERHYKRFHETIQARKCCGKIFHTKSEYYDHKENVHNERKRYGRKWKEETQSLDSSIECNTVTINEFEDSALDVISHTQNNTKIQTSLPVEIAKKRTPKKCANKNSTHHAQNNTDNSENNEENKEENNESNNEEKSKNNMWQFVESEKKIFIYRIQLKTNTSQNSAPLRSIENFNDNSLNKPSRKNALQNIVKVNFSADQENVIIYDCIATSVSDLMQLMRNSIDF